MPHSVPNSPPPESPPEIFSSVHDLVLPEPENLDPDPDPSRQQDRSSPNVLFPPFRYALPAWQKVLIEPRRFAHKPRIRVFKANLLVKMAKRLFPRSENLDFDSLRKAAAQAGHARLEEAGIPPSYGKYVRRLEEYCQSRTNEPTAGEFAALLTSPLFFESPTYFKWKDAFPIAYGMTMEELATRYKYKEEGELKEENPVPSDFAIPDRVLPEYLLDREDFFREDVYTGRRAH